MMDNVYTCLQIGGKWRIVGRVDDLQIVAHIGHVGVLESVGPLHRLALELHDLVALGHLLVELGVQVHRAHRLHKYENNNQNV